MRSRRLSICPSYKGYHGHCVQTLESVFVSCAGDSCVGFDESVLVADVCVGRSACYLCVGLYVLLKLIGDSDNTSITFEDIIN